jgi:hypothetical protein
MRILFPATLAAPLAVMEIAPLTVKAPSIYINIPLFLAVGVRVTPASIKTSPL